MAGRRLKAVSLFSGAGGLDIGFRRARFDILLSIDSDPNCIATLRMNGHRNVWQADLSDARTVTPRKILERCGLKRGELDVVFGGPPCQSFSNPGRRRGLNDERGQLVRHFCRLVAGLRPRMFLFENVAGILNRNMRDALALIESELSLRGRLKSQGYEMALGLLNAAEFGVPQLRQRAFVVGWRRPGVFYFPPATHYLPGQGRASNKRRYRTVNDAFRGLPSPEGPTFIAKRVAQTIAARNARWHPK